MRPLPQLKAAAAEIQHIRFPVCVVADGCRIAADDRIALRAAGIADVRAGKAGRRRFLCSRKAGCPCLGEQQSRGCCRTESSKPPEMIHVQTSDPVLYDFLFPLLSRSFISLYTFHLRKTMIKTHIL